MTGESARDWHAVAIAKLTNVLGPRATQEVMTVALRELGLPRIRTASELSRFAQHIASKGGFTAAVAGMLNVHVAMYDDGSSPGSRDP